MATTVPSLSASGWIEGIGEKADKLMAYYFASDYSQSELYAGKVVSLQYHIEQFGNNPDRLRAQVQRDLSDYLGRYFDDASVTVRTDVPAEGDENRINLRLECLLTEGTQQYSLGRLINTVNSKVTDIMELNNG